MARRRKAPAKAKPKGAVTEAPPDFKNDDEELAAEDKEEESGSEAPETCPKCEAQPKTSGDDETWVMCEACETWYHASCVGLGGKLDTVDKW